MRRPITHASKPSGDDVPMRPEAPRTVDPIQQVQRCLTCPYDHCSNQDICSWRLYGTMDRPEPEPKPPKPRKKYPPGYNQMVMDDVMPLVYTTKDLMDRLQISEYKARKWMKFYYDNQD